ncbi:hypothetical protein GQ600_4052 [Phytophthora cactorum]|nr:hypothetical protein GQ600_4052 [Phytophthora cactorum]
MPRPSLGPMAIDLAETNISFVLVLDRSIWTRSSTDWPPTSALHSIRLLSIYDECIRDQLEYSPQNYRLRDFGVYQVSSWLVGFSVRDAIVHVPSEIDLNALNVLSPCFRVTDDHKQCLLRF